MSPGYSVLSREAVNPPRDMLEFTIMPKYRPSKPSG